MGMMTIINVHDELEERLKNGEPLAVLYCSYCDEIVVRRLCFDDWYNKSEDEMGIDLHICSCVSGGIYSVYFECPKCHKEFTIL